MSANRVKSDYFYAAGRPLLPKINVIRPLRFGCDLKSQRGEVTCMIGDTERMSTVLLLL